MDIRGYSFSLLFDNFVFDNRWNSAWRLNIFLFDCSLFLSVIQLFIQNWRNLFIFGELGLFINLRMISLFHPSMTFCTVHALLTSWILNWFQLFIEIPIGTFLGFIIGTSKRISPKILNIMSINTARPIMLQSVRTPHSLEFSQKKLLISR